MRGFETACRQIPAGIQFADLAKALKSDLKKAKETAEELDVKASCAEELLQLPFASCFAL